MKQSRLDIFGGGPAGLATAFYGFRSGLPVRLFEAGESVGGKSRTLKLGEYRYDTGAHRLHAKDPDITADVKRLLGDDLRPITVPSQIWDQGRWIDFPIHLSDLLRKLPLDDIVRFGAGYLTGTLRRGEPENFRQMALRSYGKPLAERYLLGYTEKLWGTSPERLSTEVSGNRLRGLSLAGFLRQSILGRDDRPENIDGAFYYPVRGIGMIPEALADELPDGSVSLDSRITEIQHDGATILSFTVNGSRRHDAELVVSSLPAPMMLKMMHPSPPTELLQRANALRYRNLRLVILGIARDRISENASIYFPSRRLPFTRVYEPKNRSESMAPNGKTSLVIEIPCFRDDPYWQADDRALIDEIVALLEGPIGLKQHEVEISSTLRMPFAYPVLDTTYRESLDPIERWFDGFSNLRRIGRSGAFRYTHIHDLMREGKELVRDLKREP